MTRKAILGGMAIRRRKYASGEEAWQLDVRLGGRKRYQRSFATKQEAETELARVQGERKKYGDAALAMTQGTRLRFAEAEVKLREAGVTLEQAVEWAIIQAPVRRAAVAIGPLVEKFRAHKEASNKRPRYLRQLGVSLGAFVRGRETMPAPTVTREDVRGWLFGNGWAPKTQRNYLGDLRTLWNWARHEGYVTREHRPCDGIEIPSIEEKEICAFGPEQCETLLLTALNTRGRQFDRKTQKYHEEHVYRCLLAYTALATFEGIRPEELKRSPRSVIDLEHGTCIVTGSRAKTRQRRVVELSAPTIAWLRKWMELCPDQEMIIPRGFRRLWESLREAAQLKPPGWAAKRGGRQIESDAPAWPPDVLRHTAATMHYAQHRNLAVLQAMLGHEKDEATLFRHYRAVQLGDGRTVNKAMATKFYAILPPT